MIPWFVFQTVVLTVVVYFDIGDVDKGIIRASIESILLTIDQPQP